MMPRRSLPPPVAPPAQRRQGRPRVPDPRRHWLRIGCNDEELFKFRILSKLHDDIGISVIVREIILDEINTLLSEWPRRQLLSELRTSGLTEAEIQTLISSL